MEKNRMSLSDGRKKKEKKRERKNTKSRVRSAPDGSDNQSDLILMYYTCIHLARHGFVLEHQSKGSPGFGSNKEKRPQARILAKARKHLSLATKFDKMARNCEEKRPKFNNKKIKYYRGSARHIVSILYLQQCEFISQALHCMTNFPQHGHF